VRTVAALIASATPTLVCCDCGMSRSPAVAAAALAEAYGGSPTEWLERVTLHYHSDVSPALWGEIVDLLSRGGTRAQQSAQA